MSADFFPLDVGRRWAYEVTNESGQKMGQIEFAVQEYTIVGGTSFYVLTEFPFSAESGEPVRFVRYDKSEKYFVRKVRNDEGPLFLDDGASTEVIEADAAGTPQKFVLRRDKITLTFQRGVGIVEARMDRSGTPVIAKLVTAKPVSTPAPVAVPKTPLSTVPIPLTSSAPGPPQPPVASVSAENPHIEVAISPSDGGYKLTMVVSNQADKLLPFRFGSSQTYDFIIADDSGKEVWRWSSGNFFTQVVRSDSIRGGGQWRFEAMWDRKDNNGNPVPAGQYRLTGVLMCSPKIQASPVAVTLQ